VLQGRHIVVVGGSRGIGRAIAVACAEEGAKVGLTYHARRRDAEEVAGAIERASGVPAVLAELDVRDPDAIEATAVSMERQLGRIDGWVHSAAVRHPALLVTADLDKLREEIEIDLLAPILAARAVLPSMMRARRGVLLFVGSVASQRPVRGQAVYAAAKAGLEGLTRALAVEYARKGIRVVCLQPGAVDTDMLSGARALAEDEVLARIPQRRVTPPREIGGVAAFLLSDRAASITGSVHAVDGGYSIG
jgi:3-oxoacyl-[acyl-carrier protein] reductase